MPKTKVYRILRPSYSLFTEALFSSAFKSFIILVYFVGSHLIAASVYVRTCVGAVQKRFTAEEDNEFIIVSCDQKRWEFSAANADERDEWVAAIEEQIEKALQVRWLSDEMINSTLFCSKNTFLRSRRRGYSLIISSLL